MRGWCPVDDRVVDAPDDRCPRCGTSLVPLATRTEPERSVVVVGGEDDESPATLIAVETKETVDPRPAPPTPPAEVGPWAIAAAAVVVVVGAFLLGVAVTRGGSSPARSGAVPRAREDYTVRVQRTGAGVVLRLERFEQRGRDVVLRVTVPPQPGVDIGRIRSLRVVTLTANGERAGAFDLDARTTTTGFIAFGRAVDDARTPVTGIELSTITLEETSGARLAADLTGVWPLTPSAAPNAKRALATSTPTADGRTFRLTGLVGWSDRLEARVEVSGGRPGWVYEEGYAIVVGQKSPVEGSEVVDDARDDSIRYVIFRGFGRAEGPATILVGGDRLTIAGHWRWMFT
jgi:hypothetical protein